MLRRRPILSKSLIPLVLLFAACFPPHVEVAPQTKAPLARLRPSVALPPVQSVSGPPEIVFRAPVGEVDSAESITLVLNKPIRKLGDPDLLSDPPITIKPNVDGQWRLIGTSTLRFEPAKPFSLATRYDVEVEARPFIPGGEKLEAPSHFSFSTARPTLRGSDPERGASAIRPDALITLYFSTPVSEEEIKRAVSLDGRGPLAFSIVESEAGRVVLKPKAPLPRQTDIRVRVAGSLRGTEGELTVGKDDSFSFRTIEPLALEALACKDHPSQLGFCDPAQSGITLRFSTPLQDEALGRVLSVKPVPDWFSVQGDYAEADGSRVFELTGEFEAGQTYTVEIASQKAGRPLLDVHGQKLARDEKRTFRFGDFPARVEFGADGIYWMPGKRILPFSMINAEDTTISLLPLTKDQVLAKLVGLEIPKGEGKSSQPFAPDARNEVKWSAVAVKDFLPSHIAGEGGPVLITASYRASGKKELATTSLELQLTDIAMLSKVAHDEALVWVSSLSSAKLIPGAHIEAYHIQEKGSPLALGAADTNEMGLAAIPLKLPGLPRTDRDPSHVVLLAKNKNDWAYQTLGTPNKPVPLGAMFTERGIYRPGEIAHLKGVFRLPTTTGLVTPSGQEVTIKLLGPENTATQSWRQTLSRFGTFSFSFPIPENAPLGLYRLEAENATSRIRAYFSVDEYTPIESRIALGTDKPSYMQGERMLCTARGEWLYGGSMAGAKVSIVARRSSTTPSFPDLDGQYAIGEHDLVSPSSTIAQAAGKLDENGKFALAIPLALPGQTQAELISCEAEIRGQDGETQSDSVDAIVHATDFYIALAQDGRYSIEAGSAVSADVLALSPEGKRIKQNVHIEGIRRVHGDGRDFTDHVFATCDVITSETLRGCGFHVPMVNPAASEEIILRAEATDAKGRRVVSSYAMPLQPAPTIIPPEKADPAPTPAPPAPPEPSAPAVEPSEFTLRSGSHYNLGENVELTLTSPLPTPAPVLITVHREGFLLEKVITLKPAGQTTTFRFPITEAMVPNATVEATLLSNEKTRMQSADFEVNAKPYALKVAVIPSKTSTTPGDKVSVDVVVNNSKGKPVPNAEVTLWAVDEGSLMLTYYRTPDPWYYLFSPRYGDVAEDDTRDHLVRTWMGGHRTRPPQVRMGATSIGPRRGDFRQTVAFYPNLMTNDKGLVRQTIALPDGLTDYRVMAVAITEGVETGSGEEHIKTWKRLMARPTLPRVIRVGDELSANIALSSLDAPKGNASIRASTEGLKLTGLSQLTTPLDVESPAELRVGLRAETLGNVKLNIDAMLKPDDHSHEETDAVTLSARVVPSQGMETVSITGETSSAIAEQIADLTSVDPRMGGLSITLSTTPLAALAAGIQDLVEYPYGCTEQTVSRLVPLLELRDLAPALGVSLTPSAVPYGVQETPEAATDRAIRSLVANQKKDGSFGLWPESTDKNPAITTYALFGLLQARKHKNNVPEKAITDAVHFLKASLRTLRKEASTEALEEATFSVWALAELRDQDESVLQTLLGEQARLSLFSRALLLHTLARLGKTSLAPSLQQNLEAALVVEGPLARIVDRGAHSSLFGSEIRTAAATLRALSAVNPSHPMLMKLALGLLHARKNGHFPTTHDAAWALLALNDFRQAHPLPSAPLEAKVFLNNRHLRTESLGANALQRELFIPMAELLKDPQATLILSTTAGQLFYELALNFTPKNANPSPVDQGFFVTKRLRPIADFGGPLSTSASNAIAPGDHLLCEIEVVTTTTHSWVVLADPLPGGLAPVQTAHRRGPSWLSALEKSPATRKEVREEKVLYFIDRMEPGVHRFQYVVKATHAGSFSAPPTRIEEMYNPASFGQTPNSTLRIQTR